MIQLFVPWLGPSLNSIYAGIHWAKRKKHADAAHWAVKAAVVDAGLARIGSPVGLSFTPVLGKGKRALDCSNYGYAVKLLEDGLVRAGVLVDDTNQYVVATCTTKPVRGETSGMLIQIEIKEAA
ncbi:hypothetical protein R84981_002787 [Carnimonas sp. R-84981]|uniref:hypothetical protein n=1 Tax=Carnimonas bestiolae TaxID=3402172 RepID=UPI003EDC6D10